MSKQCYTPPDVQIPNHVLNILVYELGVHKKATQKVTIEGEGIGVVMRSGIRRKRRRLICLGILTGVFFFFLFPSCGALYGVACMAYASVSNGGPCVCVWVWVCVGGCVCVCVCGGVVAGFPVARGR